VKKTKIKMTLYYNIRGYVSLKFWNPEEGYKIWYEKNEENSPLELVCEGPTLEKCIDNLCEEEWFDKRTLFPVLTANEIIDTFDLSEEDVKFITELGEWADF